MAEAIESDTIIESQDQVTPTVAAYPPPVERKPAPVPAGRIKALPPAKKEPASLPSGPVKSDSFQVYLSEIRKFKLLNPKEEEALINDYYRTSNPEAAQRIITANLRLVVKIAMEFQSHWLNNLQDLVQEGNMGLMQALKKFDPNRGVKFSYYASYWIKANILKFIMENWRLVKIGTTQDQRKLFYNLKKEQEKLIRDGLEPAAGLVAERLGVNEQAVVEMDMRMSSGREVSLDAPVGPDTDQTQISLLPSPEEGADSVIANAQMHGLIAEKLVNFRESLTDRELIIMDKRLLTENPVTLQELGEEFGVS
jgi:RNA polymerase sigma-32 factor